MNLPTRDAFQVLRGPFLGTDTNTTYPPFPTKNLPFAPPNGTSTTAHLYVINAAKADTSSRSTALENRMPTIPSLHTFTYRLSPACDVSNAARDEPG